MSEIYYMIRYEYLCELQARMGHQVIYSIAVALQEKKGRSFVFVYLFRNQSKKVSCTT